MNSLRSEQRPHVTDTTRPTIPDTAPSALALPFDALFDDASTGMLLADPTGPQPGRLTRVNAALSRLTGYSRSQLLTMSLADLTHPAYLPAQHRRLDDVAAGTSSDSPTRCHWVRRDGRRILVRFTTSTVGRGPDRQLLGTVDDLTDRATLVETFPVQAAHDPLTGLADSTLVAGRIAQCLRLGRSAVLLHVRLDGLDRCRDVFGPAVADDLLGLAARRLTANVRSGDTVGRGGPDHFVVVFAGVGGPHPPGDGPAGDVSSQLADRLRAALAAPYRLGGIVHHVPARVGTIATRAGMTVAQVLGELAAALPPAPAGSMPGAAADFSTAPALLGTAAAARHVAVENELLRALRDDELVMFGQPIITVATGRIDAVEMLVRWQHPVRGLLPPADFLSVVEAGPLMEQVGRRVLRESCRIAASWQGSAESSAPAVFVNVSGRQLDSGRLTGDVADALSEAGLPAERLVLELTETCAPLHGRVLAELAELRANGVRLAVDDVGTGYSTLARLMELPIDILKIDRTFVAGLGRQTSAEAVVRAIMDISRTLGLPVVAEGIETVEQAAAVAAHGCDAAQGYLYGRPCSEAELARMLAHGAGHEPRR